MYPISFAGTATENDLDWLKCFNQIATHNVWNDQKQLKNAALNLYQSLLEQTKHNIELLKTTLWDQYHTQDCLFDMWVKLHELKQGSSLEEYINDLGNLACLIQLPEQQKIHYFIFGL